MTETFKAGDKVKHSTHGKVEVTYGPFTGTFGLRRYLVRVGADREYAVSTDTLTAIPEPPKFAVGDKVTSDRLRIDGTIHAGPFTNTYDGERFWVIEHADGKHSGPREDVLTKVVEPQPIKVGDRVRVLRATHAESDHGRTGTVTSTSQSWRANKDDRHPYLVRLDRTGGEIYVAEVERVEGSDPNTYTYDGVTYDLTARYLDRDGDYWTFKDVSGTVRGHCSGANRDVSGLIGAYSDTLEEAADNYGPLTRV
ncbi:phiSA1p31-related protein [Streptomyces sp. NPDC059753]|uniref:phiSA1p31-related protein n=1 Tax=Streptomyces sp. NPDC059753 TaxID=3346933 RepID=UPI00366A38E9